MAAEPISLKLTSPIYGGGGERSETEGALAKVAPTVSFQYPQPLTQPPTHPRGESDSLHSQSPAAPYECSSLRTASGPPRSPSR